MVKIKYAVSLLLLLILTCGVVFVPQLLNKQSRNALYSKTVFRTYNAGKRTTLTDRQVAELFSDNKIPLGFATYENTDAESKTAIVESCCKILENCFVGENAELYEKIKNMLSDNSNISYSRSGNLIKLEESPVALNLIAIYFKDDSGFFDIIYEEKTQTLLNFSLGIFRGAAKDTTTANDIFSNEGESIYNKVNADVKNYYENHLGLNNNQYYNDFVIDLIQFGITILPYGESEKVSEIS